MDASHSGRLLFLVIVSLALAGCSSFASVNGCLKSPFTGESCAQSKNPTQSQATRATLAVDGSRGNPRVLMFLALSGGGSRASYLSTETMIALRNIAGVDLLAEVDVMSAVSGGSLPAAFYALTRDRSLRLDDTVALGLQEALKEAGAPAQLKLAQQPGATPPRTESRLRCDAPLDLDALSWLLRRDGTLLPTSEVWRIRDFCDQAPLAKLREWSDDDARERMSRNYVGRMLGNFLWPSTFLRYWFTAFDRSDIMAQTLKDNLFDQPIVGTDHLFSDLNPTRPFLVLNATAASDPAPQDEQIVADDMAFGSSFTLTVDDFYDRVWSDLSNYPVGNAVMASSAFPLAFPHVTLENFHTLKVDHRCKTDDAWLASCSDQRYLHLFDGGNSDNLGLRAVKRILLDMAVGGRMDDYDSIVVLLVDAFTRPGGASRTDADPRSIVGRIADPNGVTEAVDALLQANRRRQLAEFDSARDLLNKERDCDDDERHLPKALCDRLANAGDLEDERRLLSERLVFYHFGFHEVKDIAEEPNLRRKLDRIPTSFDIEEEHQKLLRTAVHSVINDDNGCLQAIARLVQQVSATPEDVGTTQQACPRARKNNGHTPSGGTVARGAAPAQLSAYPPESAPH
jgi:NTE family protein